jgi:flavorubredoxin
LGWSHRADGIISEGIEVKLYNLTRSEQGDIIKEVLDARAVLVGSLTLKPGPNLVGKVWEVWKPEMAFE